MNDSIEKIEENIEEYRRRLQIISDGGQERTEKIRGFRKDLEEYIEKNPPYCPLQNKKEIDIKV
jgi:hypothetical protein